VNEGNEEAFSHMGEYGIAPAAMSEGYAFPFRAYLHQSHERHIPLLLPAKPLSGGRLLAFSPENTLSDGAANSNTKGFFDDDNILPWDTWVWYVTNDPISNFEWWRGCDSYLLSWVPDSLGR